MKKIIGLLILVSLFLSSCKKDILDIDPQDRIAENVVWSDENLVKAYQNELYNAIPHGFYIHMYSKYTDEAYNSAPCCGADLFKLNNFTPDNIAGAGSGDFWGGYMYYWNQGYQYIRKINVFLEKMAAADAIQFDDKPRLVAEAGAPRRWSTRVDQRPCPLHTPLPSQPPQETHHGPIRHCPPPVGCLTLASTSPVVPRVH